MSGRVTVREIAARAGVNPALVHRYYGTKEQLTRAALAEAQRHVVAAIAEMPRVQDGAASVFHASLQERALVAAFARATLDGVLGDLPVENPAMRRLVERFEAELAERGARGRHDPRVVVACLSSLVMGYALFGELVRGGTGLGGEPQEEVEAAIVEVLRDIAASTFRD
jgi:AcrR family transcriptional regulator